MSDEDARFVRIAPGFAKTDNGSWAGSQSKGGLTPERWDEYRRLFAEAGLSGGLNRRYRNEVFLLANTEGIVGHGTALGYVYCGEPLPLGSESYPPCEQHKESFDGEKYRYEKIAPHWYIYEEY